MRTRKSEFARLFYFAARCKKENISYELYFKTPVCRPRFLHLSVDSFPRVWFFHRERHTFSEQVCGKNMLSLFCFLRQNQNIYIHLSSVYKDEFLSAGLFSSVEACKKMKKKISDSTSLVIRAPVCREHSCY